MLQIVIGKIFYVNYLWDLQFGHKYFFFQIEAAKSRAEIELVIQSLGKPSTTDESENEGPVTKEEQSNDESKCDNDSEITADCDNLEIGFVHHQKIEQSGLQLQQESTDRTGLNEDKTSFDAPPAAPAPPPVPSEAATTSNKRMMQGKTECKICGSIVQEVGVTFYSVILT